MFERGSMATVFKVVASTATGKFSAMWGFLPSALTVQYEPGKPAVPVLKGSSLMAFKTYEDASDFVAINRLPRAEIWECRAVISKRQKRGLCWADDCVRVIEDFWRSKCRASGNKIPPGTIFCDEITLCKRM